MLFIKAVDLVLEKIDAHIRFKLGLNERDGVLIMEERLSGPLATKKVPIPEAEPEPESQPEPVPEAPAIEANTQDKNSAKKHKDKDKDKDKERNKDKEKEEPAVALIPALTNLKLEPDEAPTIANCPLKFGKTWSEFMGSDKALFLEAMTNNLADVKLETNKLLIVLRLRKNIELIRDQAKSGLKERDEKQERDKQKSGKIRPKYESVDNTALLNIVRQLKDAKELTQAARTLSASHPMSNVTVHCSTGDTEIILEKMDLLLREYYSFCEEIDTKTNRALSDAFALRDLLPSAMKQNNFVIQAHVEAMDYVLQNIEAYSQYSADKKLNVSYSAKKWLDQMFYDPSLTKQKREQMAQFFVDLETKLSKVLENKVTDSKNLEEEVLSCVDIYLGHAHSITPFFSRSVQRMEQCYHKLHGDLLAKAGDEVRKQHNSQCQAIKFIK